QRLFLTDSSYVMSPPAATGFTRLVFVSSKSTQDEIMTEVLTMLSAGTESTKVLLTPAVFVIKPGTLYWFAIPVFSTMAGAVLPFPRYARSQVTVTMDVPELVQFQAGVVLAGVYEIWLRVVFAGSVSVTRTLLA